MTKPEFPYVRWSDHRFRVVQLSVNEIQAEKRLPDDAFGIQNWVPTFNNPNIKDFHPAALDARDALDKANQK